MKKFFKGIGIALLILGIIAIIILGIMAEVGFRWGCV